MIDYLTKAIMKKSQVDDDLLEMLRGMPEPMEYFAGRDGWFAEPPRNVLVFARKSPVAAMDGGLHVHPRFVFCWCVEGGGSIMVDGALLSLEVGQGLLLFPFQQHHFSSFCGKGFLWAFISFELENVDILEPLRLRLVGLGEGAHDKLKHLVRSFHASHETECISAWLMLLLGDLVKQAGARGRAQTSGAGDPLVRKVAHLVYSRLDHPLSIEQVADVVHLSASHLRREFRQRMGISLGRFMTQARLNHALSLLHTTSLPVGTVAEQCGFESVYAFSRAFRKEKGTAPSSCRVPGISGGKA
jgi:AraC-like DNA-binding protein